MRSSKITVVIILTLLFTSNPLFSQFNLNKLKNALGSDKIADQGITSGLHKKNVGKIVWSDSRIKFDNQDNANLINEFKAGEPIYGRGYLKQSLYNYSLEEGGQNCENTNSDFEFRVTVDGEDKGVLHSHYFGGQDWTTFQITLVLASGDNEDAVNQGVTQKFATLANSLSKGSHKITLELWAGKKNCEKKKYAEGSFTYIKESGEKLKGQGAEIPPVAMTNAKLEQEMIQAIKGQGWKNESPIDIVIIESDWRINRDVFGNILNREINTYAILKDNSGNCRGNDISFQQKYNGKSYGKTEFYGLGTKSIVVDCADYGK
jgi:hypothetical protein